MSLSCPDNKTVPCKATVSFIPTCLRTCSTLLIQLCIIMSLCFCWVFTLFYMIPASDFTVLVDKNYIYKGRAYEYTLSPGYSYKTTTPPGHNFLQRLAKNDLNQIQPRKLNSNKIRTGIRGPSKGQAKIERRISELEYDEKPGEVGIGELSNTSFDN
ncbi:hypothetical protein M8J76_000358 [Diaphorina citri]|nr:hypothetical protein M8J75_000489 [Diaphorina citri]KAI5740085.1 hypothetical protein M8J76_000358 [Diaphorina citri]